MLYWYWFVALSVIGLTLNLVEAKRENDNCRRSESSSGDLFVFGVCALIGSAACFVQAVGAYPWLIEALPQTGTEINEATAVVIIGIGGLAWVFGGSLGVMYLFTSSNCSDAVTDSKST